MAATTITAGDCQVWLEQSPVHGVVRARDVQRQHPELVLDDIAAALESLAVEHATRYQPSYIVSAQLPAAHEGGAPQFVFSRVASRDAAELAVKSACESAGVPMVNTDAWCVRLESVKQVTTDADDDVPNLVLGRKSSALLERTTTADVVARAAVRAPLLRSHTGVADRGAYPVFTRDELKSGSSGALSPRAPIAPPPSKAGPAFTDKKPAPQPASTPAPTVPKAAPVQPTPTPKPATAPVAAPEPKEPAPVPPAPVTKRASEALPAPLKEQPPEKANRSEARKDDPAPAATKTDAAPAVTEEPKPTTPGSDAAKPKGNMMMAWLNKTESASPSTAAPAAAADSSEKKQSATRGRPKMTEEEKAAKEEARKAAKAAEKAAKELEKAAEKEAKALEKAAQKEAKAEAKRLAGKKGVLGVKAASGAAPTGSIDTAALLDDEDDVADAALAVPAAAVTATEPAENAAAQFDLEAYEQQQYEEQLARVAAEQQQQGVPQFELAPGLAPVVSVAPQRKASSATVAPPAAVAPVPETVKSSAEPSGSATPIARRPKAVPSTTAPASQPTLATFAANATAAAQLQKMYERVVREEMETVNGEFISRDVVVYVHKETKEEIDEHAYRQLAGRARSASLPGASADATTAPLPPMMQGLSLKPRDANTSSAAAPGAKKAPAPAAKATKAASKPAAGKKNAAAAVGTPTLASFFGKK